VAAAIWVGAAFFARRWLRAREAAAGQPEFDDPLSRP
jgi:hypothetical protein